MTTQFSIVKYYDPYGDMKSTRKVYSRTNFQSSKPLAEVQNIVRKYNGDEYYNAVAVAKSDRRRKEVQDFDKSEFMTAKAHKANYQSI
jgi:hypothetical protein